MKLAAGQPSLHCTDIVIIDLILSSLHPRRGVEGGQGVPCPWLRMQKGTFGSEPKQLYVKNDLQRKPLKVEAVRQKIGFRSVAIQHSAFRDRTAGR